MANGNTVTLTGNLTRDPELRFTSSGKAICDFSIAWNQMKKDGEKQAHYIDCSAWETLGENIAESCAKGKRITVTGRLDFSQWETKEGQKRSKLAVVADDVSLSLRFDGASVPDGIAASPKDTAAVKTVQAAFATDEEPF